MKIDFDSRLLAFLGGKAEDFSFEHRIFNLNCILSLIYGLTAIVFNYLIGIDYRISLVVLVVIIVLAYAYYLSRCRKIFFKSYLFFVLLAYAAIGTLWFLNGGINGPLILLFNFYLIIFISVLHKRYHQYLVISILLLGVALIGLEYFRIIPVARYQNEYTRYVHVLMVLSITVLFSSLIITALKNSYELEKNNVLRQQNAIQRQHQLIEMQYNNLKNANVIKSKLFFIISHDLRAPLTSLKGLINIYQDELLTPEDFAKLIRTLQDQVDRNLEVLDNLLMWSNSQMEGDLLQPSSINIHRIVEDCLQLLKLQYEQKGISVDNLVPVGTMAFADANTVMLVMRNLLSNAIKFTPGGGTIEVSSAVAAQELIISVKDNGIGITEEEQRKLFGSNHFTKVGTSLEKGTGLGLILSKEFIERANGRIWLESEPGKGSVFSFAIPLHPVEVATNNPLSIKDDSMKEQ